MKRLLVLPPFLWFLLFGLLWFRLESPREAAVDASIGCLVTVLIVGVTSWVANGVANTLWKQ